MAKSCGTKWNIYDWMNLCTKIPKYSLKFPWSGEVSFCLDQILKDWEIAWLFLIRILMQFEIWFQTIQCLTKYEVKLFKLFYFRLLKSLILIVKILWRLGITSKMSIAIFEWKH